MRDPDEWSWDADGHPEYVGPPKEEPDCGACNDGGCPECQPTPEEHAAMLLRHQQLRAEFDAAVRRGEARYDTEAPF